MWMVRTLMSWLPNRCATSASAPGLSGRRNSTTSEVTVRRVGLQQNAHSLVVVVGAELDDAELSGAAAVYHLDVDFGFGERGGDARQSARLVAHDYDDVAVGFRKFLLHFEYL